MSEILTGPDRGPPKFDWRDKAVKLQAEVDRLNAVISEERTLVSSLQGGIVEQTVRADEAEAARERQRELKMEAHARASELRTELEDVEAECRAHRAYAELLRSALQSLEQAYSNKHSPQHREACLNEARDALAKNPNPTGTVAALVAERESTPEGKDAMDRARARLAQRLETGKEAALQALTDFDHEHGCSRCGWEGPMANCLDDACPGRLRHQSGTKPFRKEGDRIVVEPGALPPHLAAIVTGTIAGDFRDWPKVRSEVLDFIGTHLCGTSRHQVGRDDELKAAATALYKWLVAVPFQEPPMKRFSIPDDVWEPFQDALFDSQFVACTKQEGER